MFGSKDCNGQATLCVGAPEPDYSPHEEPARALSAVGVSVAVYCPSRPSTGPVVAGGVGGSAVGKKDGATEKI